MSRKNYRIDAAKLEELQDEARRLYASLDPRDQARLEALRMKYAALDNLRAQHEGAKPMTNPIPRSMDEMRDKLDGTQELTREDRAFLAGFLIAQQEFSQQCAEA